MTPIGRPESPSRADVSPSSSVPIASRSSGRRGFFIDKDVGKLPPPTAAPSPTLQPPIRQKLTAAIELTPASCGVRQALLVACIQHGDLQTYQALFKPQEDRISHDQQGRSLLMVAIHAGQWSMATLLLTYDLPVNERCPCCGSTALIAAMQSAPVSFVDALIRSGADLALTGKNGTSVLHQAVTHHRADMVRHLVDLQVNLTRPTESGETPLEQAVAVRANACLREILQAVQKSGAVLAADVLRRALVVALTGGNTEGAQLLVSQGARFADGPSFHAADFLGHRMLPELDEQCQVVHGIRHHFDGGADPEMVALLCRDAGVSAAFLANPGLINALIAHGLQPARAQQFMRGALRGVRSSRCTTVPSSQKIIRDQALKIVELAAKRGWRDELRQMLELYPCRRYAYAAYSTALREALCAEQMECARALLDAGVSPATAFDVGSFSPRLPSAPHLELLLDCGLDADYVVHRPASTLCLPEVKPKPFKRSLLHLAVQARDHAALQLLVDRGAKLSKDENGRLPHHLAYKDMTALSILGPSPTTWWRWRS